MSHLSCHVSGVNMNHLDTPDAPKHDETAGVDDETAGVDHKLPDITGVDHQI